MQQGEEGLRVGINSLFWPEERTGSGQYTRHLWKALDRNNRNEYKLLAFESLATRIKGVSPHELDTIPDSPTAGKGGENALKVWWEQTGLPQLVKRAALVNRGYDVIHYPYFAAPYLKLPRPSGLIVTIHDLIPLALPGYSPGLPLKLYFKLVSTAARQADLIMADSEYSKRDIIRFLKVPPGKVQVVYLGVDDRFKPGTLTAQEKEELFKRYGLKGDERLVFYLGGFDRRKNVITLLEAFARALPRLKEIEQADRQGNWVLVLGGKAHNSLNTGMFPDLSGPVDRLFGKGPDRRRVHFPGPIEEEDKPLFYRAAEIYAFPSVYEGFGLDPLEALASGAPTLCSNATSLPEIVGEAAQKINPLDPDAWERAITGLATNPARRKALKEAGPVQAARFSWSKTAERTLELYNVVECRQTRGIARG